MERGIEFQTFLDHGHQHIDRDGNPDLSFDGVLGGRRKGFDPQMLLDPFEEQFHLSAAPVQLGDGQGRQIEVVGEKHQELVVRGVVELDAAQQRWLIRARLHAGQHDGLIAAQAARPVDRMRIQPSILKIRLGADDEERLCPRQGMQPPKVEKAAIHHVEASRLEGNLVEDVDHVQFAVGDMDKCRDIPAQIEQCVQLHGCLGPAKVHPGKQRQRQIDRRGVECIGGVLELDAEVLAGIEPTSRLDKTQGQIAIDTPIPFFVGIGERAARNAAANAEVIRLA